MKSLARIAMLALFSYVLLAGISARAADAPNVPANDYLNALQVTDSFAAAWAHRDSAGGAMTITKALRAKTGASALATFFLGTSSPQHWAFEIEPGKLVRPGRYQFPVRFYSYLFAGGGFAQSPKPAAVTVDKTGGVWLVSALPAI